MLAYLRLELLRTARSGAFVAYTVGFPIAFYLLWTTIFGATADQQSAQPQTGDNLAYSNFDAYFMVSMALYGAIGVGLLAVGSRIATERTRGWTRQLALSPLKPGAYLGVKMATSGLLAIPMIAIVMLIGVLVNDVSLPAGTWVGLVPAIWLGALPFAALGVAIGYTFRDEVAQGVGMTTYFLLAMAGGLWMPVMVFPDWMADVARTLPTYRAGELSWRLLGEQSPFTVDGISILLAWVVGFALLAVWRYRHGST